MRGIYWRVLVSPFTKGAAEGWDGSRSFHLPSLATGPASSRCSPAERVPLSTGLAFLSPGFSQAGSHSGIRLLCSTSTRGDGRQGGSGTTGHKPSRCILWREAAARNAAGWREVAKGLREAAGAAPRCGRVAKANKSLLPPLCPAPPYVCRRLCPVSAPRCVKNRGGCTACLSLPAHLTHGWASHTPRPQGTSCPIPPGPSTAFWPAKPSPCGPHMSSCISMLENKQQLWLRFNLVERQSCSRGTFLQALPGCPAEQCELAASS